MSERPICVVCRTASDVARAELEAVCGKGRCGDPMCRNYCRPETHDADEQAMRRELAAFWATVPSAPDAWKVAP